MDQGGEVLALNWTRLRAIGSWPTGCDCLCSFWRTTLGFLSPVMPAHGGQAWSLPERAGQADQDGRPSGAALAAIDLSVVRGVGSSTVVRGSVGSHRPVIAGAKLREGITTILPRGRALQGVGLSSMRFHPIGGGPKTTKMDKKHGSRQETHPLLDRLETSLALQDPKMMPSSRLGCP